MPKRKLTTDKPILQRIGFKFMGTNGTMEFEGNSGNGFHVTIHADKSDPTDTKTMGSTWSTFYIKVYSPPTVTKEQFQSTFYNKNAYYCYQEVSNDKVPGFSTRSAMTDTDWDELGDFLDYIRNQLGMNLSESGTKPV